jgi:hypothetical protein
MHHVKDKTQKACFFVQPFAWLTYRCPSMTWALQTNLSAAESGLPELLLFVILLLFVYFNFNFCKMQRKVICHIALTTTLTF